MRPWLAAAFFFSYLAIQLAVPALRGFTGGQAFRWTMFSRSGDRFDISAEYSGGRREPLAAIQKRTGRARLFRSEIDRKKIVPPYLCSLDPHPVLILFRNTATGEETRYPCR